MSMAAELYLNAKLYWVKFPVIKGSSFLLLLCVLSSAWLLPLVARSIASIEIQCVTFICFPLDLSSNTADVCWSNPLVMICPITELS